MAAATGAPDELIARLHGCARMSFARLLRRVLQIGLEH